ncbi:MAG TPA: T9SS type A sorting domain-containing protein, partial [Cyclobacteriaceae bacterium]|nr:T9SS type A sorting domain-containing protein [Cyclobacteriaceae bacterium]
SQAGNDEYNPATAVSRSFTINKAAQVITINEIADKEIDADAFDVIASVDTALPLTYRVTGPATIEGVTVTLSGETGTVTITVTQAGNENYLAAEASTSFEVFTPVTQQAQSINFPAIADRFKEEGPLTLNATATSGLAVSYEIVSGPATIAGNVVSFTGLGTVSIRASQAGNEQFLAAAPVERSFEVNTVTGVEEVQRILNLQVYPNPVAHEMHIRFNESLPVQMKMYNLQGNEVISLTDESEQRVDVSHLSSGLYLLRVNTSQGMLVYKVIKQ